MKATKIVALILGILGGLAGIGAGLLVMGLGGMGAIFGAEWVGEAVGRGIITLILSILGIIGAAIVMNKPKTAGILMFLAAVIGFLVAFPLYILASILLIIGGILALIGRKKETAAK